MSAHADSHVTLTWNPINDTNVVGYKIYYGTQSHNYTQSVDAKNATNVVISLPTPGVTYYFAATDYDSSGSESAFSNEATFVAPVAAMLASARHSAAQVSFTVDGTTNGNYVIQASTNLIDWFPVQTNIAPFTFVDTNATRLNRCFYRAVAP